ncbi:MAG: hypothetical protein ACREK6_07795 [Candidatus Rokuibacteriota bacterium]
MARPAAAPRRRRGRRRGPARLAEPEATPALIVPEPVLAPLSLPAPLGPEPVVEHEELELPLARPEPLFAARVLPPPPAPPLPNARRVVFFDVENTSRAEHVNHMIEHLAIDRAGWRTEFMAVGNWRVIGPDTARLLAHHGAQLVHSAPSAGVRDWSDLRIAVSAGVWLAGARAGDVLEIVSDDRAFDAVGDVAVSLGITFRRVSYRAVAGTPAVADAASPPLDRSRPGGRHGRNRGRRESPAHPQPTPPRHEPAAEGATAAHTAPHDEVVDLVRELVSQAPGGSVLIDTVANALKTRGFSRPPGSPRLITRLRRMREVSVSPTGMIRLVGEVTSDNDRGPADVPVEAAVAADLGAPVTPGRRRRRSRRGGRRRSRSGPPAAGPA